MVFHFEQEKVIRLALSEQEYVNLAKIPPSKRTEAQEADVQRGRSMQTVRNADFAAHEAERFPG